MGPSAVRCATRRVTRVRESPSEARISGKDIYRLVVRRSGSGPMNSPEVGDPAGLSDFSRLHLHPDLRAVHRAGRAEVGPSTTK